MNHRFIKNIKAFTLVELLIVISVIGLLTAILMPALSAARSQARSALCKSNLRQLVLANLGYSTENDSALVLAASDIWNNSGFKRWHGIRDNLDEPFDPLKGPLAGYLSDGRVKQCPQKVDFADGFEQGCGGYGYNMTYLGSRLWQGGLTFTQSYQRPTHITEVLKPSLTLMFADCAISWQNNRYIEYSFAEPPFTVYNGEVMTDFYMSPSIHFRHRNLTNVVWTDGHVSPEHMTNFNQNNVYSVDSAHMKLGWFEPVDNTFFDLK
jgi:prepilin-type N-terminal cleavage/methylation domain-containing protein/prepilin-type processing-associated H-X9-DG protein